MTQRTGRHGRGAALLLEVVVALGVLVSAIGLMCAQLASGVEMTVYSEEQFRASLLAERTLGLVRLDPQMRILMEQDEELEYAFTDDSVFGYPLANEPGYFWRVVHEPVDREDEYRLRVVTIQILHQTDRAAQDDLSGAEVVRELVFLQARRATRDLAEEAGLSEDQIEQLRQQIPIPGFDPRAVDMQLLMSQVDEELLAQYLPMLMPMIQQLAAGGLPEELSQLASQFGSETGAGGPDSEALEGSAEELADMIRQAVESGQVPDTPGGPPARGGRRSGPPRDPFPAPVPRPSEQIDVGRGSGPSGEYTIEDLMRMRDEYERQQRGGL